jgi:outer membrane receptor protein involved in Fe transport
MCTHIVNARARTHGDAVVSARPTEAGVQRPPLARARWTPLALGLSLVLAAWSARAADDTIGMRLEDLMTITVVGASKYAQSQNEVAASVSVITRQEIQAFGWRTLEQALTSLPGVYSIYDRQYSFLGVRGFGLPGDFNTRILVLVNGNRYNDATYDSAGIGRMFSVDMDLVDRIEFMPGPGGAVYGQNAMLGVVNVVTRTGSQVDGGELSTSYQGPQAMREGRATWGKALDNGVDVLLSASGMRSRGKDLFMNYPGAGPAGTGAAGVAVGQDGERDKELLARMARGPWALQVTYGDRRKNDPAGSYFSDALAPGQYTRDSSLNAQLQYNERFDAGRVDVMGRVFAGQQRYTALFNYFDEGGGPNFATGSSDVQGAEARLLYTAVANHKLMLGLELQRNARVYQSNDDLTTIGVDTEIQSAGSRVGLYLQDDWRLHNDLSATFGVRADHASGADTLLSPRAALIWNASPETTVKTLYGRAHRAPNAYERDYDDGVSQVANSDLKGETIDTLELTMDRRLSSDLTVRGSLYQWRLKKLIELGKDPASGLSQYQTGADAQAKGMEISADKIWDSGARLRGSLSYQNVQYVGGLGLPNSPRWLGKLDYSRRLPWAGLRMGYELQYSAARQTISGATLEGYWLSHLNLSSSQLIKGVDLSVAIRNLFDRRYAQPASDINWQDALEQDGRSVRLRLDHRF